MASVQWDRVKEIIDAFHQEAPDDPEAWLDERCGDNEALRREVRSLLQADQEGRLSDQDRAADRLSVEMPGTEDRLGDRQGPSGPPGGEEGSTVGPYRLLEEIGVGGMSVVYRAERTGSDFEQTVALKLMQRRLGDEGTRQRFRAERQVLASLDHPSIAQLIDGGVTEGGRPYFVMEYVEGRPITEYASANELGLEARLDLLQQTAEALQAAHRQLVVHRDLKPSNVFVAETEAGAPKVKLLDFGIAKLLGDTLPVTRPRTQTGRRPMTPAYAAPEQVGGEEISTQTDVYQLGMLAYELLAGGRPFDVEDASPAERERIIKEERPTRPSGQADGESGVAAARLQGDLDTVVLKALRKEPDRRYASVAALMEDLRRYRADKPVRARPVTAAYRARKFVERNARAVAGGATVLLVVVGLTAFYIHRISEERDRARREAQKAEAVAGYLTDLLQSTRPDEAGGDTVTAADMLRRGQKRIDRLSDQPAVQARMLQLLGNAHRERANYQQAGSLLRRSLSIRDSLYGPSHRSIANTLEELATLRQERGRFRRADSLWRKALKAQRKRFGPNSPKLWEPLNNLGIVASRRGKYAEAESFFRKALKVEQRSPNPDSGGLASVLHNLAIAHGKQGRYGQSASLHREVLQIERKLFDPPHPSLANSIQSLGLARMERGRYIQADSLLRRSLAMYRNVYEPPHPRIATVLLNRGILQRRRGHYAEAHSSLDSALSMLRQTYGDSHPSVAIALDEIADTYGAEGRIGVADSLSRRALAAKRQAFGPEHPRTAHALVNRGNILRKQGRLEEAAARYRKALSILRDQFSRAHPDVAEVKHGLGRTSLQQERYAKAEPLLQESLRTYQDYGKQRKAREVRADLRRLYQAWGKSKKAATVDTAATARAPG